MYGGFDTIISYLPDTFSNKSDSINVTFASNCFALSIATFNAFWDKSTAVTSTFSASFFIEIAMHPEPVHISNTLTFLP